MLSPDKNQLTAHESVCKHIIQQQVYLLAQMRSMGTVAWEKQVEDWRAREENTVHVMEAEEVAWVAEVRAAKKATKKAK